MKRKNILLLTVLLTCLLTFPGLAKEDTNRLARISNHGYVEQQLTVIFCDGPVYYRNFNEETWHRVELHQTLMHGDSLRTGNHGYAVLAWSADNLIMVKPKSGMRFTVQPQLLPQLVIQLFKATLMLSARDSGLIEIEGRHASLVVNHGDTSIQSNDNHEVIKAVKGQAACRLSGMAQPMIIPESYLLEIKPDGTEQDLKMFDPQSEYEAFRRFSSWQNRFSELHQQTQIDIPFAIDQVKINGNFISNLPVNEKGYYQLDSGTGKIIRTVHLQFKITPYPSPRHNFELYLGKELAYAVREGSEGYHEVVFPVPAIPEFLCAIHSQDSLGRKVRIFKAGFEVQNQGSKKLLAQRFCEEMSLAMSRHDHLWLRGQISRDYRDWQGNTNFDFLKVFEDTLRTYRDVRLWLHPFRYEFSDRLIKVHLNYRLSALTADWNYRYEDRGSDIFTLIFEDGYWRLYSKTSGLFFARLKVAVDLRQGVLAGRVVDERTRTPISGVRVTVQGTRFSGTTDSMGEYRFYNVTPGEYDLKFQKNGFGEITATKVTVKAAGEQFK
ncbi:MAG: carboxypeptidase-like regulatory domain-containing protein [Candidatus Rifleibacteriota bacterium]